jgi:uncharacterized protein YndB with AHSA1/START domain
VPVVAQATRDTTASPDAVWAVWADWPGRPRWHPRIDWARLDGPLEPGTTGAFKPDRARPVDVRVAEVRPGRRLVVEAVHGVPLARGHYEHEVEPVAGGGARITHRLRLTGPLARPIGAVLGRMLGVSASPEAVAAVARLAEAR